jgi:hypothetical protein
MNWFYDFLKCSGSPILSIIKIFIPGNLSTNLLDNEDFLYDTSVADKTLLMALVAYT